MNIFKRLWIKHLIKREFKREFVDTGYVKSFKVLWDREKNDYLINYIPMRIKNLDDMKEPETIEEQPLKEQEENEQ
jgi:hypothetical protein